MDITSGKASRKSTLTIIIAVAIAILAVAAYLFLAPLISKSPSPGDKNSLNLENAAPTLPIEKTADEVIGDVSNPYEDILNKANPFKDEYRNPFE